MKAKRIPKRRKAARWFALSLTGLLGLIAAAAAYLLFSAHGAEALTKIVLYRCLGLRRIRVERSAGNLYEGFTVHNVQIPAVIKGRARSTLVLAQAHMEPILTWKAQGPTFTGSQARLTEGPLAEVITAEAIKGSVFGGIQFRELHFSGLHRLPLKSTIDIQTLESGWPVGRRKLRSVQNGRLRLEESDPILFFGTRSQDQVEGWIFSKAVVVQDVLSAASHSTAILKGIRGTLNDLNLTVNGAGSQWTFKGTFQIAGLANEQVRLANNAARVDLQLQATPKSLTGRVVCWGGTFTAKQIALVVRPSTLSFTGDLFSPALDLNGSAKVGLTQIEVSLIGTKDEPHFVLNSEPPMLQETLLAMLVTGKTWRGTREALAQGQLSTELATDFIDYVFFGGAGNRIARGLGITDFGITQDMERNFVGAQTTIADRVMLDVEVDPSNLNAEPATTDTAGPRQSLPYRLGAEYQVTERTSVRLEGEHTPIEQKPAAETDPSAAAGPVSEADNTVLLKVKRRF